MEIKERTYSEYKEQQIILTAGAGEILDELIFETATKGYWGLENLSHIPGTVGATPVQNVGAYGVEVADVIHEVVVLNSENKKIEILENKNCKFNYRESIFKTYLGKKYIIVSVKFLLTKNANPKLSYADLNQKFLNFLPTPNLVRQEIINIRKNKFPNWNELGTAGSFFKNPLLTREEADKLLSIYPAVPTYSAMENKVKISLGYILDKVCNLRGFVKGRVRLYENQALVLVAEEGATTAEIISFAKIIEREVYIKTEINILMEVTII